MKKLDREYTDLGIAFLDVISCGFGAIIMLVILAKDTPLNSLKQESAPVDLSDYQHNISIEIAVLESKIDKLEFDRTVVENRLKKNKIKKRQTKINFCYEKKPNKL